MWLVAVTVYGTCKLLTIFRYAKSTSRIRLVYYLFLEPGLNANRFLGMQSLPHSPSRFEWLKGSGFAMTGLVCIYCFSPLMIEISPGLVATVGMIGVVLLLHFGVFDLLSNRLCARGFHSTALMNDPWRAGSVAEFWSRWNTGFRDFSRQMIFYPMVKRRRAHAGLWLTFLFSGLIHDLVISLPARGGYGGPTIYFLLQALAIDFERTQFAKRIQLNSGPIRFFWVLAVMLLPVSLLFHQPFRDVVVLPMLRDMGAIL